MAEKYLSCLKVAKSRQISKIGDKVTSKRTRILMAFENVNGISFTYNELDKINSNKDKAHFKKLGQWRLRFVKRDDGSYYFNFYKRDGEKVRIADPAELDTLYKYKVKGETKDGFKKAHNDRLYILLKKFCRRNKVNLRGLSKNPLVLMRQLCYPGVVIFGDNKKIKLNAFFKQGISRSVLSTNGSRSKKLLIEVVSKFPEHSILFLREVRDIKRCFGLDKAQDYLQRVIDGECECINLGFRPEVKHIMSSKVRLYKQLTYTKVIKILSMSSWLASDTITMYHEYNPEIKDFQTGRDLHDDFALQCRGVKQKKRDKFKIESPEILTTLKESWDDNELELSIPEHSRDLINWSNHMSNCVSSYSSRIRSKSYYIVGVKLGSKLYCNIGFSLYKNKLKFDQWSIKHNGKVPEDMQSRIKKQFNKVNISLG